MRSFFIALMSIFVDMSTIGKCRKEIFSPQDLTEHYKNEINDFQLDGVYIGAHYVDVRDSIEAYKYRSDRQYAWEYVDVLAKVVDKYVEKENNNCAIIAIPMHWSRYMIRGFDHIGLLVTRLSSRLSIPYEKPLQAKFTHRQSKLSKAKRMQNRDQAFRMKTWKKLPEIVMLVDDIISTGSTVNACAKILKASGVKKVYGVFIASNQ